MRLVLLIALSMVPGLASAAEVFIYIGGLVGATGATAAVVGAAVVQVGLTVAMSAYGSMQRKKAARSAKRKYNESLQDRMVTSIATESPQRFIYGRARVGARIIAMFQSGNKDQYKHLVCVLADHECDAIEEIYIAGKALGTLDGNGAPTSGDYVKTHTDHSSVSVAISQAGPTTSVTLPHDPAPGSISAVLNYGDGQDPVPFTVGGRVVTITQDLRGFAGNIFVAYSYTWSESSVTVKKHLGYAGEPADAYLVSAVPSLWTANHRVTGKCYLVVTLDLNEPEFQGGPPSVEALVRGAKLYDFRNGTTAWSQNVALAAYHYLTSDMCGIPAADLPMATWITAANACGQSISGLGERYTINGTVTADQDPDQVLEDMADAMAGNIVSTTWDITAGVYTAPVMALYVDRPDGNGDVVGSFGITPGAPEVELWNGVRGQYVGSDVGHVATDFKPYQNAAFVSLDGREMWTDMPFPFTETVQRVHNICRIRTEEKRNSLTFKGEFSMKAWRLKIDDRVTLTSTLFGWNAKVFVVQSKRYVPRTMRVEVVLKEDTPEIWDFADAVSPEATPNTNLPNPFEIKEITALTCASGQDHLLLQADGTIVSRIHVSWPEAETQAVFNGGAIELQYQRLGDTAWQTLQVPGNETSVYLSPVNDRFMYVVRARAVNLELNVKSDWRKAYHLVVGKSAAPPQVSGFVITQLEDGTRRFAFNVNNQPIDVRNGGGFRIKHRPAGTNTPWAEQTLLATSLITMSPFESRAPAAGNYDFGIVAVDSTGNESATISALLGVTLTNGSTAASALAAAQAAQADADEALGHLTDIFADDVLTRNEKPRVKQEYDDLLYEQTGIDAQADSFSVSRANYDSMLAALTTHLVTTLGNAHANFGTDTNLGSGGGATLRAKFSDAFLTRQLLLNAIYAKAKSLADAAQTTATNAANAASAAQTAANAANAALTNIASDNMLTRGEKPRVVAEVNAIMDEFVKLRLQADAFQVSRAVYDRAVWALHDYLGTLAPSYDNLEADTAIVGPTLRQKFAEVYAARQVLLNGVSSQIKTFTDEAQADAAAAQAAANSANAEIANIASDDVLSRVEKPAVNLDYTAILDEEVGITQRAQAYGVDHSYYTAAIDSLIAYLNGLSPAWNDYSQNTSLGSGGGATLRSRFASVYSTRQTVLNGISQAAGTVATWGGVVGTSGKLGDAGTILNDGAVDTGQIKDGAATFLASVINNGDVGFYGTSGGDIYTTLASLAFVSRGRSLEITFAGNVRMDIGSGSFGRLYLQCHRCSPDINVASISVADPSQPVLTSAAAHNLPIGSLVEVKLSGTAATRNVNGSVSTANGFYIRATVLNATQLRLTPLYPFVAGSGAQGTFLGRIQLIPFGPRSSSLDTFVEGLVLQMNSSLPVQSVDFERTIQDTPPGSVASPITWTYKIEAEFQTNYTSPTANTAVASGRMIAIAEIKK